MFEDWVLHEKYSKLLPFAAVVKIDAECANEPGRFIGEWLIETLDGPGGSVIGKHWDDLTDFPILGTREIWEFSNPTSSMPNEPLSQ